MLDQNKIENRFNQIIDFFGNAGISDELTLSFINNNFDLLTEENTNINENLFFIFNNQHLYGVMLAINNNYSWSILNDFGFPPLKSFNEIEAKELNGTDFIVEMMINFASSEKFERIINNSKNLNIQQKIKILKDIGLNSNGYHFR